MMKQSKPPVNPFTFSEELASKMIERPCRPSWQKVEGVNGLLVEGLLSADEALAVREQLDRQDWQAVGLDGIADHYGDGDPIGSWRATFRSECFARALWQRLGELDLSALLPEGEEGAQGLEVNPLLRCIRYKEGGLLVPHYDGPYDYGDGRETMITLVLYLGKTGNAQGGATRFLKDTQDALPCEERDFSDWERLARPDEVLAAIDGQAGSALLFEHRILHDSEPLSGFGEKTIIRSDVVFAKPGYSPTGD